MLWVYVTLLSTGPSWLFTLFAIWTALLPDFLVAIWETYSVGGGVLVNKVHFLIRKIDKDFNVILNVLFVTGNLETHTGTDFTEKTGPHLFSVVSNAFW